MLRRLPARLELRLLMLLKLRLLMLQLIMLLYLRRRRLKHRHMLMHRRRLHMMLRLILRLWLEMRCLRHRRFDLRVDRRNNRRLAYALQIVMHRRRHQWRLCRRQTMRLTIDGRRHMPRRCGWQNHIVQQNCPRSRACGHTCCRAKMRCFNIMRTVRKPWLVMKNREGQEKRPGRRNPRNPHQK